MLTIPDVGRLSCRVPAQLPEIPLDEDPAQRATRTYEALLRALPERTPAHCWDLVSAQETALAQLVEDGAVYVGVGPAAAGVVRFAIMIKDAEALGDRPLAALAEGLAARGEPREITVAEFPAGPALVTDEAVGGSARLRHAQVIFAFPDRRRLAVLSVSGENLADWPEYVRLLAGVAGTVSFSGPG